MNTAKTTRPGGWRGWPALIAGALAGLCLLATSALQASDPAPAVGPVGAGSDWTGVGGAADETNYSRLGQITAANARRLGLAWYVDLPREGSLEGTPLEVGGVVYVSGSLAKVYAVDGATGKLLWIYDPMSWKVNTDRLNFVMFPVNRGLAYADGRIFGAAFDGRLFAIDAKTGKELWITETIPAGLYYSSSGAPRTFKNKVIIGQSGADIGMRGFVSAFDQATGKLAWRFYTAPGSPEQNKGDPAMERAAATWGGEYWKTGTGGTVWNGMTFDPELDRIYIGTSNAGPYDPDKRSPGGGDNLYTASIVALDPDTGKYLWHYQVNPREAWDYKATANMNLASLVIDGKRRKVLMQAPTNGFFYVIDRETGRPISAEKIGKVTWAERIDMTTGRPVEAPGIRYENGDVTIWPSSSGAHNWQPMSYSAATGLVYSPYMQMGSKFSRQPFPGSLHAGGLQMGTVVGKDPADGKGALLAWDPVAQKLRWRVQHSTLWNGGILSTAGNLVFQGAGDGWLTAYDARSGARLWRFQAGMGIIGAPISYELNGRQYVSVLAGYGGSAAAMSDVMNAGWHYRQPRRLLTFALDAARRLPPGEPRSLAVQPLDDPGITIDPVAARAGGQQYIRCMGCHGRDLNAAGGPGPDLRESPIAMSPDALWSLLHDGLLIEHGMPRFSQLSHDDVMQLYAYIRAGARKAASQQQPLPAHAVNVPQ
jgi:quinohemoprotein ethanol dehydrogenase